MTKLLDEAVIAVRRLPPEVQDQIARAMLALAGEEGVEVHVLTPEERADIVETDGEVARGEFAADEDVRAVWAKFGL